MYDVTECDNPHMEKSSYKLFGDAARSYAAYRPRYPTALVDVLVGLCSNTSCAWDCACGTGQLSVLLADRFNDVIATDASTAQIEQATPHPRVKYHVAVAESSHLPDSCCDLVAVAQAAHWLNLEKFYLEAHRVSKPEAVVALVTYGELSLKGEVELYFKDFYYSKSVSVPGNKVYTAPRPRVLPDPDLRSIDADRHFVMGFILDQRRRVSCSSVYWSVDRSDNYDPGIVAHDYGKYSKAGDC
ncbi:MAG: class I SAM-dependent methyltransferase [Pirellula sp.]|nr:class I SAM-dependent methyltransferase [Pirellula sp.]